MQLIINSQGYKQLMFYTGHSLWGGYSPRRIACHNVGRASSLDSSLEGDSQSIVPSLVPRLPCSCFLNQFWFQASPICCSLVGFQFCHGSNHCSTSMWTQVKEQRNRGGLEWSWRTKSCRKDRIFQFQTADGKFSECRRISAMVNSLQAVGNKFMHQLCTQSQIQLLYLYTS